MRILISILHTLLPHLTERFKMVTITYSRVCSPYYGVLIEHTLFL